MTHPRLIPLLAALLMPLLAQGPAQGAEPLRVLILSGQNNHQWQTTTPVLKEALESTGRFQVTVTEKPETLTAADLAGVAVIVSNWNTYGKPKEGGPPKVTEWPEALRTAYVDFVRKGGGHVAVHAGSSSFPEWTDYQAICLATWKAGQTGHGPKHEFEVRIDEPAHPVMAGMKGFRIFDELWHRAVVHPGTNVLASSFSSNETKGTGAWEPCVLAGKFGEGRCFTILLGHGAGTDGQHMASPHFRALFARGTEWAASGKVTIPPPAAP
jgi:uncharacterized protein